MIKLPKKKYTPKQDVQLGKEAAAEVRKQSAGDDRLEVAALVAHAVFPDVDGAGVELIAQQRPDRLRAEGLPSPIPQTCGRHLLQNLLLREAAGRVVLERLPDDGRAFRIVQQALAQRTWSVDVRELPSSQRYVSERPRT